MKGILMQVKAEKWEQAGNRHVEEGRDFKSRKNKIITTFKVGLTNMIQKLLFVVL